jgi:hypothetical protein
VDPGRGQGTPAGRGWKLARRSTSGFEVDFIIGDHTAVEVKATVGSTASDLK